MFALQAKKVQTDVFEITEILSGTLVGLWVCTVIPQDIINRSNKVIALIVLSSMVPQLRYSI